MPPTTLITPKKQVLERLKPVSGHSPGEYYKYGNIKAPICCLVKGLSDNTPLPIYCLVYRPERTHCGRDEVARWLSGSRCLADCIRESSSALPVVFTDRKMMKIWLLVCFLITVVLAKERNEDRDTSCEKIEGRCVDADARCSDVLPGICPNQEICCAKGKGGERLRVLHKKKAAGAAGEPDGARVNHAGRRPSWRTPQHNTRNLANVKGKSRDRDGKELRNRAASKTGKNKNKRLRNEEIDKLEGKQINAGKKHGGSLRKTARGQKPDPSQKSVHGGRSKMTKQKNRDEGRKKQRKEGNMKTPKVTKTKTESKKKQEPSDAREDTVDEKIAGCRPRSRCRNNGGICKNKCSKKEKEINKGCKGRRCKCCVLKGCKTKAACVNQGGICTKERECLSNNFANTGCRSGCVCCLPPL
ncbi:serine/arginine-rich splicing factor 4-like [Cherax quadricarinatus]|uniref:serine/arginine-rich splicing factor 4-like n=1 Tax=Cherax quadricarinatus TaxID=27406 RepID=UPI00387E428F